MKIHYISNEMDINACINMVKDLIIKIIFIFRYICVGCL